jgi:hypothetical protein
MKVALGQTKLRNEDIRNEFGIFHLYENITEYRGKIKMPL